MKKIDGSYQYDLGPFDSDQTCGLVTSDERESMSRNFDKTKSHRLYKNLPEKAFDRFAKGIPPKKPSTEDVFA